MGAYARSGDSEFSIAFQRLILTGRGHFTVVSVQCGIVFP